MLSGAMFLRWRGPAWPNPAIVAPWLAALALLLLATCGPSARATIPKPPGRVDAPYELASDEDLDEVRADYDSLALGDPGRSAKRNELADEYVRRIEASLRRGKRDQAFLFFEDLLGLWQAAELPTAHEAAEFTELAETAETVRSTFAKSGGDLEAAGALYALMAMQPQNAEAHLKNIEEIFSYGDELAVLQHGAGAKRSRPIAILESTVRYLPLPAAVDHLIRLYRERQVAIKSSFRRKGADIQLLRVHGPGVLTTTQNIVRVLAESGRIGEAAKQIASLSGIGDDAKLRSRVISAKNSTEPTPWLMLSASFREAEGDEAAALAICREAIRRYPRVAMAHVCAGESAEALGNPVLAIRHFESARRLDSKQRQAAEALAALYEQRVTALAYSDRPNAALRELEKFERLHKAAAKQFDSPLSPDLASAYAAMGRGLVSLGELEEAHRYLRRSIKLRPNLSAYEYQGTIALRQGEFEAAQAHFERALALPETDFEALFHRAELRRLSAEALEGSEGERAARDQRELAFADWLAILNKYELSPEGEAEARLEIGKLIFNLGKDEEAMREFLTALGEVPNDAAHADIVAFLLQNQRYSLAKDVYLDALGHQDYGQYYKIYMSLWILAEAKKLGLEPDYHATNYLRSLEGKIWCVQVAQYAIGAAKRERLEKLATTRGRRAELLYYRAVLGPESENPEIARQLLEEVVKGSMVLFFEFDMARKRLREMR